MTATQEPAGTRIPRWTRPDQPASGTGVHREPLPAHLAGALREAATAGHPTWPVLLLAAHLRVLAAITAERHLVTGVRTGAGQPLVRCHAELLDGTWEELLALAAAALASAVPAGDDPVESVLDLAGPADQITPTDPTVLVVSCATPDGGPPELTIRYRREVLAEDFARRLAGYHRAALGSMVADPTGRHEQCSLLSATERELQVEGLAGPQRPLPAELFVALFQAHAATAPTAVAAIHNGRSWTYRELNERANRIAHRLLAAGLAAEDVVAVVVDRHLDWLAAMLGVVKAGGAYLPVRPDFPAERVGTQLVRGGCRFAIADAAGDPVLTRALAATGRSCLTLPVPAAGLDGRCDDPGVRIDPQQLAYVYFTSGSTGTPKGAMCEHAGMLNHLYAKVDDLALGAGDVVTQTASQCFDISLWQLAAPLLVGGATEIIDTDDQLDVGRFVARLAAGGIQVIQIVPSYLDVLLSFLERHPQSLGDLRSVSVTGEALKLALVQRWFAVQPEISLVNAYGATEVSDDTMHEILTGPPQRPFVSVGRSLRNVRTYILDEHSRLAPLGAPGEIAFAGVCVGRGYINDPERTRQAFTDDPYRRGDRMYRTGDFGRWLPEGRIEFLGRRDQQVKIRGFRIEIGEIENRLLRMPGVGEAAVVVHGTSEQTRAIVAFCTGPHPLQPADLRDFLASALPDYMVPAYFHQLDALPLSENGKVDKERLRSLARAMALQVAAYLPPRTETERRLATVWAEVLNVLVGRIGRDDDFFRLGGTSLAAVRLVVKLDRRVSLREVVGHPTLRDLAAALDRHEPAAAARSAREARLLQQLATPVGAPSATLVCFPYAGGNAVNFQSLARACADVGVAVTAVELPGHDLGRPDEVLVEVATIAERALAELPTGPTGPLLLWGHCAGAAYAIELARLLEARRRPAHRLFLGAMLLDEPDQLLREIEQVSALSNREITDRLHDDAAYIELDLLKTERADLVGRAFRHDVCSTNRALLAAQLGQRRRLSTPVEVVVADDDPTTSGAADRYGRWELLAESVTLVRLAEGGHYFIRSRPTEAAGLITACSPAPAAELPA
ncbi:MAG: amino acid adenylation domain-containing protein [Actinobacteria bacterium]|nr:amino acid adenylation domain-containing protein [Actinomycetota bacterium]